MCDVEFEKKRRQRRKRPESFFDAETRVVDLEAFEPSMMAEGSTPGDAETDEAGATSRIHLEPEAPNSALARDPSSVIAGSNPPSPFGPDDSDVTRVKLSAIAHTCFSDDVSPTDVRAHQPHHVPVELHHVEPTRIALHRVEPMRRRPRASPPIIDHPTAIDADTELTPTEKPEGPFCPVDAPQLAAYQIAQKIGDGGMGIVYQAVHRETRQKVAIKYMRKSAAGRPELVKRFLAEAVAASRIDHPGITTLYDYGHDHGGVPYLVMEYLEGTSLGDRLEAGRLGISEFVAISQQLAFTLDAAHAAGIVHRDLKPDNVFLTGQGASLRVKVLDFGVAKFLNNDLYLKNTSTGQVIGTPFYMSPEQCGGQKTKVDSRADIYSLGCVMYEMLTGRVPFPGNLIDVVVGHRQGQAIPIGHFNPEVPQGLVSLIEAMMAKDPDARPRSMAEVAGALAAAAVGAPTATPAPRDPSVEMLSQSRERRSARNMLDTFDSLGGQRYRGVRREARRPAAPYSPHPRATPWLLVPVVLALLAATGASLWLAGAF